MGEMRGRSPQGETFIRRRTEGESIDSALESLSNERGVELSDEVLTNVEPVVTKEKPGRPKIAKGSAPRMSGGSIGHGSSRHRGGAKKPLRSIYG